MLLQQSLLKKKLQSSGQHHNFTSPDSDSLVRGTTVVYFRRVALKQRHVSNEAHLLDRIKRELRTPYKLIVVESQTQPVRDGELIASWARMAALLQDAAVLIGPHGGALNNMIFAPSSAHIVEINMRPGVADDVFRPVFWAAAWAQGFSRYWSIGPDPASTNPREFYLSTAGIRVDEEKVLQILRHIGVVQ